MSDETPTRDNTNPRDRAAAQRTPGIALVWAAGEPMCLAIPVHGELQLGRDRIVSGFKLEDERLSRRHCVIRMFPDGWSIKDHGSRNGTFVDGAPAQESYRDTSESSVLQVGNYLFLVMRDLSSYKASEVILKDDRVIGPHLAMVWETIAQVARSSDSLLIEGESGVGKELAASHFHAMSPHPRGPFVPMNCAAIPQAVAERVLFGTCRGAYTGAVTAPGLFQNAHGGTLFLDEIGELDLAVQAKLLRVLASMPREVTALGASHPIGVDARICLATHKDLSAAVWGQRFREDLYHRIKNSRVRIPPLRERREEIPWLVVRQLGMRRLTPHIGLIEECMLRPWPGNTRELLASVEWAAGRAIADRRVRVEREDLDSAAGIPLTSAPKDASLREENAIPASVVPSEVALTEEAIREKLARVHGNQAEAQRQLGIRHRTTFRRLLAKFHINPNEC